MAKLDALIQCLPLSLRRDVEKAEAQLTELRLRTGRNVELVCGGASYMTDVFADAAMIRQVTGNMLDHSLYAREEELRQGYFTLRDGSRVGISGRYAIQRGQITDLISIHAICVRIAREVRGCCDLLSELVLQMDTPQSVLLVSSPGGGKTTCLRELVRIVSDGGWHVGLVDERGELAALSGDTPTMDIGCRTDVMDSCPKRLAIPRLLRSMAPDVIAVDELGDEGDALAVREARRCGAAVFATAHAGSFQEAAQRKYIGELLREGIFPIQAILRHTAGGRQMQIRRETKEQEAQGADDAFFTVL